MFDRFSTAPTAFTPQNMEDHSKHSEYAPLPIPLSVHSNSMPHARPLPCRMTFKCHAAWCRKPPQHTSNRVCRRVTTGLQNFVGAGLLWLLTRTHHDQLTHLDQTSLESAVPTKMAACDCYTTATEPVHDKLGCKMPHILLIARTFVQNKQYVGCHRPQCW